MNIVQICEWFQQLMVQFILFVIAVIIGMFMTMALNMAVLSPSLKQ